MAGLPRSWGRGESWGGSGEFAFTEFLMRRPLRDYSKKLTRSTQWDFLIKQRVASAWCWASFGCSHQSFFCSCATANALAASWGQEKWQRSSKARHVTPETCVLREIKVVSKALCSWEILFIINIYIMTRLLAKHMFTFLHCVFFFLRDGAGQRFLQRAGNRSVFSALLLIPMRCFVSL